jgi:hypothetical protein
MACRRSSFGLSLGPGGAHHSPPSATRVTRPSANWGRNGRCGGVAWTLVQVRDPVQGGGHLLGVSRGRARRCGRPSVEGGVGESDHDRIEPVLVDAPLPPGWRSCWATRLTGSRTPSARFSTASWASRSTTTSIRWEWPARVPWRRSSWPAGVTDSADQYCTCVTGAPAACRDGR